MPSGRKGRAIADDHDDSVVDQPLWTGRIQRAHPRLVGCAVRQHVAGPATGRDPSHPSADGQVTLSADTPRHAPLSCGVPRRAGVVSYIAQPRKSGYRIPMQKIDLSLAQKEHPELMQAINQLCQTIKQEPNDPRYPDQSPHAFIVGGFVRDLLLNFHPKDADVEIFGVSPERIEQIVHELFPSAHINFVGESFGILKVHFAKDIEFDVAIPRTESKIAAGHKGFSINSDPNLSFKEAARRRDFTINAISLDPLTGELHDPYLGLEDMEAKLLRVVDPQSFQEDPLRVYRGIQFAARLAFDIEEKSLTLMKDMVARGDLEQLSKERVTEEMKKLFLKAEKPSIGFSLMRELGIIERSYPELQALTITPQEPEWHPEGDVWIHTLMTIDQAAKILRHASFSELEQLQIMVGALCHDLGKPPTTHIQEKDGIKRIRSLGHQEAGDEPTQTLMANWTFSAEVIYAARMIALNHLRPGELWIKKNKGELDEEKYVNAVRKLLKRIHPVSWRILLASAEADFRGRTLPNIENDPFEYGALFTKIILQYQLDEEPTKPLIHGQDLLDLFHLEPGPYLGDLIRAVENERDQGNIKTREQAIEYLKTLIKK